MTNTTNTADLRDTIRASGGIVHSDGNVFFTSGEQFLAAARAALAAPAQAGDLITIRKPSTRAEIEWLAKLAHLLIGDVNNTLDGLLAAGVTAAPAQAGEYPPLGKGSLWRDAEGIRGYGADPGTGPWYTTEDVHRAIDADRAARGAAQAAPVDVAVQQDAERLRGLHQMTTQLDTPASEAYQEAMEAEARKVHDALGGDLTRSTIEQYRQILDAGLDAARAAQEGK